MSVDRMKAGLGFGILAVLVMLGIESHFDLTIGRDGYAFVAIVMTAIGSALRL